MCPSQFKVYDIMIIVDDNDNDNDDDDDDDDDHETQPYVRCERRICGMLTCE